MLLCVNNLEKKGKPEAPFFSLNFIQIKTNQAFRSILDQDRIVVVETFKIFFYQNNYLQSFFPFCPLMTNANQNCQPFHEKLSLKKRNILISNWTFINIIIIINITKDNSSFK